MADWSEGESSSSIGSPSSSLPQSIREVLESVRAECNAGVFGSFCSSDVLKPPTATKVPYEEAESSSREKRTTEPDDVKRVVAEMNSQTETNFETGEEFSKARPCLVTPQTTALEGTNETAHDLTEVPNSETQNDAAKSPQVSAVQGQMIDTEDVPEAENRQLQESVGMKRLKTISEPVIHGQHTGIHTQPEDFLKLKREKLSLNGILTDCQKTNAGHWIKIDGPNKKLNLENVSSLTESQHRLIHESDPIPTLNPRETKSLETEMESHNEQMKQDALKRKEFVEMDLTMRTDILDAHRPVISSLNMKSNKKTISGNNFHSADPASEKQMIQSTGSTDYPKSPVLVERNMKRRKVDRSLQSFNRLEIEVNKTGTMKNAVSNENKIRTRECSSVQKCVTGEQPRENVGLREDEVRAQRREHAGYLDSTEESKNSDHRLLKIGLGQRGEQRTYTGNEDGAGTSEQKGPNSIFGYDEPRVQFKMDLDSSDDELQTINETLEQDEPIKSENLNEELEEKYSNVHVSADMTSIEGHQEFNSGYEEIDEFVRICDESLMTDVENIKVEILSDDEHQVDRNERYGNTDFGEANTAESGQESWKHSLNIWRQELLSSDFNLIYGSLRAVLMRNISKDHRHRLIQTMIATMSEIEEVIMGEGKPVQHSVRCETPEPSENVDTGEETENKVKDLEKEVEDSDEISIKNGAAEESLQIVATLREREVVLNMERMKTLMKKCSDGTLKCLVCMKTNLPNDRVCRACSAFAYRIERNYTIGFRIPTCDHVNYSNSPRCKSCRFRKFNFMSATETDARLREVRSRKCPVCTKTSFYFRGWKCTKCYNFAVRLARKKQRMPTCKHSGEYSELCAGCRCYMLQVEWFKREPLRSYPLPIVKKHLIEM